MQLGEKKYDSHLVFWRMTHALELNQLGTVGIPDWLHSLTSVRLSFRPDTNTTKRYSPATTTNLGIPPYHVLYERVTPTLWAGVLIASC